MHAEKEIELDILDDDPPKTARQWHTDEWKQMIREMNSERGQSEESKRKLSEKAQLRYASPEAKDWESERKGGKRRQARTLFLRGAAAIEVATMLELNPNPKYNNMRARGLKSKLIGDGELRPLTEDDELRERKRRYARLELPEKDYSTDNAMMLARGLVHNGFLDNDVSQWDRLASLYDNTSEKVIPPDEVLQMEDMLRQEAILRLAILDDSVLTDAYNQMGNDIDPEWFAKINQKDEEAIRNLETYEHKLELAHVLFSRGATGNDVSHLLDLPKSQMEKLKRDLSETDEFPRRVAKAGGAEIPDDEKNETEFAKKLITTGHLGDILTSWRTIRSYFINNHTPPPSFSGVIRLEVLLTLTDEKDSYLLDEYLLLGKNVDPEWFEKTHEQDLDTLSRLKMGPQINIDILSRFRAGILSGVEENNFLETYLQTQPEDKQMLLIHELVENKMIKKKLNYWNRVIKHYHDHAKPFPSIADLIRIEAEFRICLEENENKQLTLKRIGDSIDPAWFKAIFSKDKNTILDICEEDFGITLGSEDMLRIVKALNSIESGKKEFAKRQRFFISPKVHTVFDTSAIEDPFSISSKQVEELLGN